MTVKSNVNLFDARARAAVIAEAQSGIFDLVIVGGGINGAGIAHDAALRGLKVVVIEQRDLAFGTSSRSSKLIHGGLRYLEHYQFKLVFEGTNERNALRGIAPHLVRPLLFALPVYEGARHPLWLVDVGLWMYDSLARLQRRRRHTTLRSPKRMLEREPLLSSRGLTGGIIYYDCMTDDARLTLENAMAAAELGSPILTHASVVKIDGVHGRGPVIVEVRDELTCKHFTLRGRAVVNGTGAWADRTRGLAQIDSSVVRPTKGVHLVIPRGRLPIHHANALLAPQDGRVFFAIPWNGLTVIGTTDTDFRGDPGVVRVDAADVEYLLLAANHNFPGARLDADDVIATWAGLRPLISADTDSASDVPREHKIFRDGRLITVAGGKLTTYRRMAAEVVDEAADAAGLRCAESSTAHALLPGARRLEKDFDAAAVALAESARIPADVAQRLVNVYGSRARGVAAYLDLGPTMRERISPDRDVVYAEVAHAVDRELALTVEDVLVRRTSIALTARDQGLQAAERVADLMGARLGWDAQRKRENVEEYERAIALTRAFRTERAHEPTPIKAQGRT